MSGKPISAPSQVAAKGVAEQKKKLLQLPAVALKKMQEFLKKALSRKDTSLKDYIPMGNFYFSKKLLLIAALFMIAAIPVIIKLLPHDPTKTPTLRQGSKQLAAFSGKAKLQDKAGSLIYEGDLAAGAYQGSGKQFAGGKLVYQGNFDAGARTGPGKEFFPDGKVKYQGEFQNNQYSGVGSLFSPSGAPIFSGNFENGLYHGAGKLYDTSGNPIYEGQFAKGKREGLGALQDPKEGTVFKGFFKDDAPYYEGFLGLSDKRLQEILGLPPKETGNDPDQQYDEAELLDNSETPPSGRDTFAETSGYIPDNYATTLTYNDYAVTFILEPSPLSAQKKHVAVVKLWGYQQAGMIDLTQKAGQIRKLWGKPLADSAVVNTALRGMSYRKNGFNYQFYYSPGNGTVFFLEIK